MKILRKCVDKPLEIIETSERWFMDCARSVLGADVFVERVYLDGYELILAVDEDGLLKRLPLNFFMAFHHPLWPVQAIVGDVVFIRNKPVTYEGEIEDWEVFDVTEDDIERVRRILAPDVQAHLTREFKKYNRR